MKKHTLVVDLFLRNALLGCGSDPKPQKAGEKSPLSNLVILFIDDMGYGDTGPFSSTLSRALHLDIMAAEGMASDLGERNDLSRQFPERVTEMHALLKKHATDLRENRRPAAFFENPKPLSVQGTPSLAEYLGVSDIEVVEGNRPNQ
jgi:hypothetical protein